MSSVDDAEREIREFFLNRQIEEYSSNQIRTVLKRSVASTYPALLRLVKSGFLESRWASEPYPRRRLYKRRGG